jgi:RNA polymerase sporulation-specific sigma factor
MTQSISIDVARSARRRLVEAAQQGDHAAQHELVRRYEPLVQRVVWRLGLPPGYEREDVEQEARIGLVLAIRAWRAERGPFPAFADRCVSNQALLAIYAATTRKQQVLSRAVSLDRHRVLTDAGSGHAEPAGPSALDRVTAPQDARSDPQERLLVHEQLEVMMHALPTLTSSERVGLAMALNGESYKHHQPTPLTPTPKAASQAAYRARRKLAAALARAA